MTLGFQEIVVGDRPHCLFTFSLYSRRLFLIGHHLILQLLLSKRCPRRWCIDPGQRRNDVRDEARTLRT